MNLFYCLNCGLVYVFNLHHDIWKHGIKPVEERACSCGGGLCELHAEASASGFNVFVNFK